MPCSIIPPTTRRSGLAHRASAQRSADVNLAAVVPQPCLTQGSTGANTGYRQQGALRRYYPAHRTFPQVTALPAGRGTSVSQAENAGSIPVIRSTQDLVDGAFRDSVRPAWLTACLTGEARPASFRPAAPRGSHELPGQRVARSKLSACSQPGSRMFLRLSQDPVAGDSGRDYRTLDLSCGAAHPRHRRPGRQARRLGSTESNVIRLRSIPWNGHRLDPAMAIRIWGRCSVI